MHGVFGADGWDGCLYGRSFYACMAVLGTVLQGSAQEPKEPKYSWGKEGFMERA